MKGFAKIKRTVFNRFEALQAEIRGCEKLFLFNFRASCATVKEPEAEVLLTSENSFSPLPLDAKERSMCTIDRNLNLTLHLDRRMNQRAVTRMMLDLALQHGEILGDRCVLSRKAIEARMRDLEKEMSQLRDLHHKGGIVVVVEGDTILSTWRLPKQKTRRSVSDFDL